MKGPSRPTSSFHRRIPSARLLAPRQDFCFPSHWPARPTKGWLPNQKKGVGSAQFSFFYLLASFSLFLFKD